MMNTSALEELVLHLLELPRTENLNALKTMLAEAGTPFPADAAAVLEQLWEPWCAKLLSQPMARLVIDAAACGVPENGFFRKLLPSAVKVLLPPFLNHTPILKAIGVRDETIPAKEVAARFNRLLALKSGSVIFLESSRRWGIAGTADSINGTLPVNPFGMVGGKAVIPLENVLKDVVVLASGPELIQLVEGGSNPVSAARFRMIVEKRRQVAIPESRLKLMAQCGCARRMDAAAFERYWSAAAPTAAASTAAAAPTASAAAKNGKRRACDGRSLQEIEVLLDEETKAGAGAFTDNEIAAFHGFFERLKMETAKRESKILASIIAKLSDRASGEKMRQMLTPLVGKTAFWPEKPAEAGYAAFEVWGELSSKLLEKLSLVASQLFDEDYLAACALKLPLKALNCLCTHISDEALCDMVLKRRNCGADLLMWIWKNRKKRSDTELLQLVNLDNVSRILGGEEPPKAWGAARREMRAMLLDDQPFQGHLIDMLGGNAIMFGSILQSALYLDPGERQSLMVKIARQSPELQKYLENGAGQKILNAGIGKNDNVAAAPVSEPTYTSVKSHQALIKELDDIINIYVPENREALKTARAHGDFRENSEFDAAKERRNHLSRRRTELERELANIQPVIMAQVEPDKSAVIGSEIEIRLADGKIEKYYLLGAWDGDPDRSFLSYRTRLGKAVLNHRIGETFEGPDGKPAELIAVRALPEAIIRELDV